MEPASKRASGSSRADAGPASSGQASGCGDLARLFERHPPSSGLPRVPAPARPCARQPQRAALGIGADPSAAVRAPAPGIRWQGPLEIETAAGSVEVEDLPAEVEPGLQLALERLRSDVLEPGPPRVMNAPSYPVYGDGDGGPGEVPASASRGSPLSCSTAIEGGAAQLASPRPVRRAGAPQGVAEADGGPLATP